MPFPLEVSVDPLWKKTNDSSGVRERHEEEQYD